MIPRASGLLSTRVATRFLLSGQSNVHILAFCDGIGRIVSSSSAGSIERSCWINLWRQCRGFAFHHDNSTNAWCQSQRLAGARPSIAPSRNERGGVWAHSLRLGLVGKGVLQSVRLPRTILATHI